jgi:MTH538 TIR-like domain (DUF1863)
MANRVYFCFHYQDVTDFRANVVRNHWLTKRDRSDAGFFDASLWESARKQGDTALRRLINGGIDGSSVTCVLIGSQTYARRWVRYEIMKSFKKGNSIFGIHINSIPAKDRTTKLNGPNPFEYLGVTYSSTGITATLHEIINGKWAEYTDVDTGASYQINPVPQEYRDKGFNFGRWFPVYDWVANDGYDNFSSWVG